MALTKAREEQRARVLRREQPLTHRQLSLRRQKIEHELVRDWHARGAPLASDLACQVCGRSGVRMMSGEVLCDECRGYSDRASWDLVLATLGQALAREDNP